VGLTLAEINEAIAAVIPDREAIVTSTRRLSWRDFQLRSRRLANLLLAHGLGCRRQRDGLQPWESGQDHLALYLYNGPEYLEGMIGAFKARAVPFNVNYRYVEDELAYLLRDAGARAIVYHATFAPLLARVLEQLPPMVLMLQVDDGSGEPLLPGALDYERALAGASDAPPPVQPSDDDLYMVYTGGTTGMPKGVLWRQIDIFYAALGGKLPGTDRVNSIDEIVARVPYGEMIRALPVPPFMHAAGHWTAFINLHQGGTVIIQEHVRHLDGADIWRTVERERVFNMSIVGDAFARPLIEALRAGSYDLSSLRVIGSGGALLSPENKRTLLELLPGIMVADGYGSSETGAQGATLASAGNDAPASFRMDDHTVVLDEAMTRILAPGEEEIGWLARRGHVPLGYLGDPEKTRRTYPTIGGERYSVPGDRAQALADGSIRILGRDSVCINTGGEKVFAEEVEAALKRHPAVADVVVVGTPNQRWGQQVTAVVALRENGSVTAEDLRVAVSDLARYKLPRAIVFVSSVVRSPSGKPDYRWAKETALAALLSDPLKGE
jgi:acyl-CoA synthetase (AMP-forming)/AMP-acid ligase II